MKKVILFGSNPNGRGGIQTFSKQLSLLIDNLNYITIYPIVGDIKSESIISKNIFVKVINKLSNGHFLKILSRSYLKKDSNSTFIINSPQDIDYLPRSVNKIILVQHTTLERWWDNSKFFNRNKKLLKEIRERCHVVSLSAYEAKVTEEKLGLFNISVIRNPGMGCISNSKRCNNRKLVMLSRLDNKVKCIDEVIKAVGMIGDHSLEIFGSGPDERYLTRVSEMFNNVTLHGWTDDSKSVLDKHSILIISSKYEGYPMSAIEAMELGIPIIIRDTFPSVNDIVINNGVIIDNLEPDNIKKAINCVNENYEEFSEQSKKLAHRHQLSNLKELWKEII
ncbi:glycosyltransferase [Vibrio splendidus]|uniref:glycosyltransferase n=1 Tax=Vibrio splendidus TaxID=29497 RepID=UPI00076A414E|nr:glycosyltransferase [Vibrio splendidus]